MVELLTAFYQLAGLQFIQLLWRGFAIVNRSATWLGRVAVKVRGATRNHWIPEQVPSVQTEHSAPYTMALNNVVHAPPLEFKTGPQAECSVCTDGTCSVKVRGATRNHWIPEQVPSVQTEHSACGPVLNSSGLVYSRWHIQLSLHFCGIFPASSLTCGMVISIYNGWICQRE
jgi:hypothetical protein